MHMTSALFVLVYKDNKYVDKHAERPERYGKMVIWIFSELRILPPPPRTVRALSIHRTCRCLPKPDLLLNWPLNRWALCHGIHPLSAEKSWHKSIHFIHMLFANWKKHEWFSKAHWKNTNRLIYSIRKLDVGPRMPPHHLFPPATGRTLWPLVQLQESTPIPLTEIFSNDTRIPKELRRHIMIYVKTMILHTVYHTNNVHVYI